MLFSQRAHKIPLIVTALALLVLAIPPARAFPNLIVLHDVAFSDGGTATGEFSLNVIGFLNTPTSITTTAGSVLGSTTYTLAGAFSKTATSIDLTISDPPAAHAYLEGLNLQFALPLGSVEFDPIVVGVSCEYTNYACSGPEFRTIIAGYAQIPEPGSIAMLGGAMLWLGAVRRRFSRRTA